MKGHAHLRTQTLCSVSATWGYDNAKFHLESKGRIILLRRSPSSLRMGGWTDSDVLFLIYTSASAVGAENNSPPEQ